jgi:hypothetical protein
MNPRLRTQGPTRSCRGHCQVQHNHNACLKCWRLWHRDGRQGGARREEKDLREYLPTPRHDYRHQFSQTWVNLSQLRSADALLCVSGGTRGAGRSHWLSVDRHRAIAHQQRHCNMQRTRHAKIRRVRDPQRQLLPHDLARGALLEVSLCHPGGHIFHDKNRR